MRIIVSTRFDWSPHTSQFIVRMPTSTHDIFRELFVQEIGSQLKIVAYGRAKDLVRDGVSYMIDKIRTKPRL